MINFSDNNAKSNYKQIKEKKLCFYLLLIRQFKFLKMQKEKLIANFLNTEIICYFKEENQ